MADPKLIFYGADWDLESQRIKALLGGYGVDYDWKDIDSGEEIMNGLKELNGEATVPTLVVGDKVLKDPKDEEVKELLKLSGEPAEYHEVLMVGAGPSALSAAIYTTREDLDTVLVEKGVIGGLAAITDQVDNYPGFAEGVEGLKLAEELQKQAERFGATIKLGEVTDIVDEGRYKLVKTTDGDVRAKAVLIATGSDYKKLGIPGEKEFFGRGVHYCATCDGAFYRDKRLVVVGGGNSAAQEALFLTKFATHIDMLVRSDQMRASDILAKKVVAHDKITVHFNTTTDEIIGEDNKVVKVIGTDKTKNTKVELETDGVFVFVGLVPNTDFLKNTKVELDQFGFIVTDKTLETAIPGVFASGDVRSGATMQIASATGEGATAALMIRSYLEELG